MDIAVLKETKVENDNEGERCGESSNYESPRSSCRDRKVPQRNHTKAVLRGGGNIGHMTTERKAVI